MLSLLQCPLSGQSLRADGERLVTDDGSRSYRVSPSGVPLFGDAWLSGDGAVQRSHYDRIAGTYLTNLGEDFTRGYSDYLDEALNDLGRHVALDTVAELCCGAGEGLDALGPRIGRGVGVDVSQSMLEVARLRAPGGDRLFVQGDATRLPLKDGRFDTVVMLGGIHHVNDRHSLFAEVARILKPGGALVWREPVDDFALWRVLRRVVYRWSTALQSDTERPLRYRETRADLERAGFVLDIWRPLGFLAYCFLMNSDVMTINRVWRLIPGARRLAGAAARFDDWSLQLPGLASAGLLVVGVARRR
jgi:SAM-dependent methyltransferase